ncbi:hypothetical protein [Ancylobacter sp. FA202]|uniref:hypothetical protein n=1 Tax=Ancylobacter sp. FA202 TaxID=1111106 RepID=UPI00037C60C0|nr:hypothetical protein [Ancylobacter sp. FA202]
MHDSATPAARPPLLILSVATGYGGAERNVEILLPLLLAERRVTVFACNTLHLQRLRQMAHPRLDIHAVDATRGNFIARAARSLVRRVLTLRPSAILTNTLDSLRILARAAEQLPGLDAIACVAAHDFLWFDHERLLPQVRRATVLVPDRSVLESRTTSPTMSGHTARCGPPSGYAIGLQKPRDDTFPRGGPKWSPMQHSSV